MGSGHGGRAKRVAKCLAQVDFPAVIGWLAWGAGVAQGRLEDQFTPFWGDHQ